MNSRIIFSALWNMLRHSIARSIHSFSNSYFILTTISFQSIIEQNTFKCSFFSPPRIHIMAGKPPTLDAPENDVTYLRYPLDRIILFLFLWFCSISIFFLLRNILHLCHVMNRNLQFAAENLESTGIIGVIEPINTYSVPGYYLNNYEKGEMWNWV